MKPITTLILFCIITIATTFAQHSSSYTKGLVLDTLKNVYIKNITQRTTLEKQWREQANATGNKELQAFVEMISFFRDDNKSLENIDAFFSRINNEYKEFPNVAAIAYILTSEKYFSNNMNYEKVFTVYLELEKLLEQNGPNSITDYSNYYSKIASVYYKFRDFQKSIELQKKGLSYTTHKWGFYNTIGVCFIELGKLDSAVYYLQKAVAFAENNNMPEIVKSISLGNIGYSYYLQKKYALAKPFLIKDLKGALRVGDIGLAAGAAIPLADVYLFEKKWDSANTLLIQARNYITHSNQLFRLEKYFFIKSKYYKLTGNLTLALLNIDSAVVNLKQNDSAFNSLLLMRVQQSVDLKTLAEEKNKLDSYKKLSQIRIWAIASIFTLIIIVFLIARYYRSQILKDKKRLEELKRILELRQRLSADIHDDIGSTLSSISLFSHSLLMQPQNDSHKNIIEKIRDNAQNIQESLSDIIWSVNPNMDSIEHIVARMRAFGGDISENTGISFSFNTSEEIINVHTEMDTRKNIYLIYKEALNNAVKYSKCKQIEISLTNNEKYLHMTITDDGIGFDTEAKQSGNGLVNMKRRASEIKANLTIYSNTKTGTNITLTVPVGRNL